MYLTWLDSNSWLIELANQRILLDPWLVGSLVFGNLAWFFEGKKNISRPIPENIDLILLSQGLEDHTHPPTLKLLDRNIPVVASPNAAKVVKELGYKQINTLAHEETFTFADKVEIKAVPGSPIGPTLVENGYLLKDLENGQTLYYEPHGYHSPSVQKNAPIDVIITPTIDIKIPLLGSVIKGQQSALEACKLLQPQVILPTAAGGDITFGGLLTSVLRSEGNIETLRTLLAQNNLSTQVIEPKPAQRFAIDLEKRAVNVG
jgi:L-ascorbate metabolism protein UlaG (beta-lactamase superfamily)